MLTLCRHVTGEGRGGVVCRGCNRDVAPLVFVFIILVMAVVEGVKVAGWFI